MDYCGPEGPCLRCGFCIKCDCGCPPEVAHYPGQIIKDERLTPKPALSPRERYFARHAQLCAEALELSKKKNQDYASGEDPFRNFRTFGSLGFLVRMSDKLSRLRSFVDRGEFAVIDETTKDTLIDIINYACLLQSYWEEGNK